MSVCMCVSLNFPFAPQYFPQKTLFFQRFRKYDVQTHRVFPDFRQKDAGSLSQQKSRQGESSLGPLFCDTVSDVGWGGGGVRGKNAEQMLNEEK